MSAWALPLPAVTRRAAHRYSFILALASAGLVFAIVAPQSDWARATAVGLSGLTLVAVLVTSEATPALTRVAAGAVLLTVPAVAAAAALTGVSVKVTVLLTATFGASTTAALVAGVARLVRARGVTLQAVLGGVAIYLLLGVFFTYLVGAAARLGHGSFFVQSTDGTLSEYAYFSFTVLTTTGFGDLTAATSAGRAIAVAEMLVGQIYLVTVISVLVSHLRGRLR